MIFDGELNKDNILNFQSNGIFGIFNEISNLILEYTNCISGKAYTSTFKNSKTQYNNCIGNYLIYENAIWLNSIVNIDDFSTINTRASLLPKNLIQLGSYTNFDSPELTTKNSTPDNPRTWRFL